MLTNKQIYKVKILEMFSFLLNNFIKYFNTGVPTRLLISGIDGDGLTEEIEVIKVMKIEILSCYSSKIKITIYLTLPHPLIGSINT